MHLFRGFPAEGNCLFQCDYAAGNAGDVLQVGPCHEGGLAGGDDSALDRGIRGDQVDRRNEVVDELWR